MKVIVGGNLIAYTPGNKSIHELDLKESTTLFSVLEMLNIPKEKALIVAINQTMVNPADIPLSNNDEVVIYNLLSGG
jgi:sulfur carrier protein ThiS